MSRSIRKNIKNNQRHVFTKYSEAEFYEVLGHIEAEALCAGNYRDVVRWYKRWTYEANSYAEYSIGHIRWLSRVRRAGWSGASKSFVDGRNRVYRRQLKQQLDYATQTETWDAISWHPFIKDADQWY